MVEIENKILADYAITNTFYTYQLSFSKLTQQSTASLSLHPDILYSPLRGISVSAHPSSDILSNPRLDYTNLCNSLPQHCWGIYKFRISEIYIFSQL